MSYQEFLYLNQDQWAGGQVFVPLVVADNSRRDSSGFCKIMRFREVAAAQGYDWVWADTVCIDKTSRAELSEAINSMFRWYSRLKLCYVYLSDVLLEGALQPDSNSFKKSEWIKRGWTLQELIAPYQIEFRDVAWNVLGNKTDLQEQLSCITSIPENVLTYPSQIFKLSTADRLSLAVGRKTNRVEDRAYSLFGLFRVSMPLLYGEGDEAFRRLQHSILQRKLDPSILAHRGSGLLANSVDDFAFHRTSHGHPAESDLRWRITRYGSVAFCAHSMLENVSITLHYNSVRMFTG